MKDRPKFGRAATLAIWLILLATPLLACSVPVFRYALERWPVDPYEVYIFHRGELTAEEQAVVENLGPDGKAGELFANVEVQLVDLDAELDPRAERVWHTQETDVLPHVAIQYPALSRIPIPVWSGAVGDIPTDELLDSPVRQELARRLIAGDTAVWVLLESGDAASDDPAFKIVKDELAKLEQTLELPELAPEDIAQGLVSADTAELAIKFSTLRLSRDDADEKLLIDLLLGTEADLRELEQPMAFPIFGRGRVLYALIGAGINKETLQQAGLDLTGPCTCTVKEQNPGTDLLMSVDWNSRVETNSKADQPLPPLTGLAGFGSGTRTAGLLRAAAERAGSPASPVAASTDSGSDVDVDQTASDVVASTATESAEPAETASKPVPTVSTPAGSSLRRNLLIAAGVLVLGVVLGSVYLVVTKG